MKELMNLKNALHKMKHTVVDGVSFGRVFNSLFELIEAFIKYEEARINEAGCCDNPCAHCENFDGKSLDFYWCKIHGSSRGPFQICSDFVSD